MLKRITKVSGLLVSVASIMSIVPVQAADYETIDAQDGTIYSATVKGKCIFIDGEINGEYEAAYWVTEDGKYNKINGLETQDTLKDLLANKYLEIDEGSNDYTYVNITDNYKIVDYDVRDDLEESEAILLKSKIRKDNDGRFDKSKYSSASFSKYYKKEGSNNFLSASTGLAIFQIPLEKARLNGETKSTVFADSLGNYVDADYNLGNLKIYTGLTTGASVTIKNTESTYEIKKDKKTYQLKAVIKENKEITDISDYIYRFADLTIYKKEKGTDDEYIPITKDDGFTFGKSDLTIDGTITVFQKFSKTPATDNIDGIKYSKDSTIYFITDKNGEKEYLLGKSAADASTKVGAALGGKTKIASNEQGFSSVYLDVTNKKIYVEGFVLKTKNGFNYLDISDNCNSDVDLTDSIPTGGGFVWFINNHYIQIWDGDKSFKKLYKIDGSMNKMSIGGKDNLILWNEDTEAYSIIHNVALPKTDPATTTTSAAATVNLNNPTNGWINKDNMWNYILPDGTKKIGWLNNNGIWYYLKDDGVMATGWIKDNNSWYYCDVSGAMLSNTTVDGYALDFNGKCLY
ncbi:cell wall-binding protein [Clostridium chromiireducens]|uniref:N-acetylmuramoyl-L-alanine amidase family protein n=1 Tax=Clostridium chromiireducens TaxID=225345 RepID=UPI003AF8AC61